MEHRVIVHQFNPDMPVPGGIDTCIRGLLQYAPDGYRFTVFGTTAPHSKEKLGVPKTMKAAQREYTFIPVARLTAGDQSRCIPHSLRMVAAVGRYISSVGDVIVQTHRLDTGAALKLRLPKMMHVQFLHIDGFDSFRKWSDSLWRSFPQGYAAIERLWLPRADDVVVFNEPGVARIKRFAPRARFSPTWFDPEINYPSHYHGDSGVILWAGRVEDPKDPMLAVDTVASLGGDFRLTVVGIGTRLETMRRYAQQSGVADRINFLGAVSRGEVADLMRRSTCLLMTSHYEGFPRVMVEALSCGLPVAATQGSDPSGFLEAGRGGVIATDRSPNAVAEAVQTAVRIPRQNAVAAVEHLSAPDVVKWTLSRHNDRRSY